MGSELFPGRGRIAERPAPGWPSAPPWATAAPWPSNLPPAAQAPPAPRPSTPPSTAPITKTYEDYFDRADLGPDYNSTSPAWRIQTSKLCVSGAHNHPLWLTRRLPINARIEFDAIARSEDGDLKVEVWGDGQGAANQISYTNATGYLVIYGGWKNTLHVLARLNEHGKDRLELAVDPTEKDLRARAVKIHHPYHFKIERRDGKTVRWFVDDLEMHAFADPQPLKGTGHEHLGFQNWEAPVCFDSLVITPLE